MSIIETRYFLLLVVAILGNRKSVWLFRQAYSYYDISERCSNLSQYSPTMKKVQEDEDVFVFWNESGLGLFC